MTTTGTGTQNNSDNKTSSVPTVSTLGKLSLPTKVDPQGASKENVMVLSSTDTLKIAVDKEKVKSSGQNVVKEVHQDKEVQQDKDRQQGKDINETKDIQESNNIHKQDVTKDTKKNKDSH